MRSRFAAILPLTLSLAIGVAAEPAAAPAPAEPAKPAPRERGWRHHSFDRFIPGHGRLGVQLQDMTPELREFLRAPKERGVLIVRVEAGSAAEEAGLKVGDVLVTIDGEAVRETYEVVHAVMTADEGAKLALEVVRAGKTRSVEAALAGAPPAAGAPMRWMEKRMPELRESFEQRMRDLEQRMQELEERLKDAPPEGDPLDT